MFQNKFKKEVSKINMEDKIDIESLILDKQNIIIGKNDCKYCHMAIKLLVTKNVKFTYVDHMECQDYVQAFIKARGKITYPQIFINGTRIGGYNDLEKIVRFDFFIVESFIHDDNEF